MLPVESPVGELPCSMLVAIAINEGIAALDDHRFGNSRSGRGITEREVICRCLAASLPQHDLLDSTFTVALRNRNDGHCALGI